MIKKKKVGILTFHRAINYGAVLQAYALAYYLNSSGYQAEIIDYYSKDVYDYYKPMYFEFKTYRWKTPLKIIHNGIYYKYTSEKRRNFLKFIKNFIICSESIKDLKELQLKISSYDYIITGSDQVWSPNISKDEAFKVYSLAFFDSDKSKKISYAASIGECDIKKEFKDKLSNSLLDYTSISVREQKAKEIIERKDAVVVCDPTLLLNEDDWKKLSANSTMKLNQKYIFVYMLEKNNDLIRFVNILSNKKDLSIIYLNKETYFKKDAAKHCTIDPIDFLSLVKNAEYVVTNSFHGIVFSIIFKKQFLSFLHTTKFSRQTELLNRFGLIDYIHKNFETDLNVIDKTINYTEVASKKDYERELSRQFLSKSLSE